MYQYYSSYSVEAGLINPLPEEYILYFNYLILYQWAYELFLKRIPLYSPSAIKFNIMIYINYSGGYHV
jgi:hypothetical protein